MAASRTGKGDSDSAGVYFMSVEDFESRTPPSTQPEEASKTKPSRRRPKERNATPRKSQTHEYGGNSRRNP